MTDLKEDWVAIQNSMGNMSNEELFGFLFWSYKPEFARINAGGVAIFQMKILIWLAGSGFYSDIHALDSLESRVDEAATMGEEYRAELLSQLINKGSEVN